MKFALGTFFLKCNPYNKTRCSLNGSSSMLLRYSLSYGRSCLQSFFKALKGHSQGAKNIQTVKSKGAHFGTPSASLTLENGADKCKRFFGQVIDKCSVETWAALLRRNAAKRLMFGTGTSFSLLGFSLAKEPTLLTQSDELKVICQDIRGAFQSHTKAKPYSFNEKCSGLLLRNLILGKVLAKGCNAVVYSGKFAQNAETTKIQIPSLVNEFGDFGLAVKMMFNYDAESNATAIWKAMRQESVPAQSGLLPLEVRNQFHLPSHPNIVEMYFAFPDYVPDMPEGLSLYPDALPRRLNQEGLGRNMTFFLIMKRYHCTLREYLKEDNQLTSRVSLLLLTQLLEGLIFLKKQKVAHRDLKSDNLLLDLTNGPASPVLVITDFGCCIADKNYGLKLPFLTDDSSKGGNAALMAPEVACAVSGKNCHIDYSYSDGWAAGTIAYELFGAKNPFYKRPTDPFYLKSEDYKDEDLPPLPPTQPSFLNKLIKGMLRRDVKKRLDVNQAGNFCQLLLHCPSHWLSQEEEKVVPPTDQEVVFWIVALAGVSMYYQRNQSCETKEVHFIPVEQSLRSLFLSRIDFDCIKESFGLFQNL